MTGSCPSCDATWDVDGDEEFVAPPIVGCKATCTANAHTNDKNVAFCIQAATSAFSRLRGRESHASSAACLALSLSWAAKELLAASWAN